VAQVNFGLGARQGNLQLYTSKFGLLKGNARLNLGDSTRLKELRCGLMKSPWFEDAVSGKGAPASFEPNGPTILPPLSQASSSTDVKKMLRAIHKKLGPSGRAAMVKYLDRASLPAECEAANLIHEVFGEAAPASDAGPASKASGRKKKAKKQS
jgi:hypothetical protein